MILSQFKTFHPLAAIATTPDGARQLQPLCQVAGGTLYVPPALADLEGTRVYEGPMRELLADLWPTYRALVFCMACGAVVRLIAPLLQDKSTDPAVVVLDAQGQFAISLCGGHQGGADRLAQLVARQLGAKPVLTGASASSGLPAADLLGTPFGWHRGDGDWTGVSAAIARGERVRVIQTAGSTLWRSALPEHHTFEFIETETIPPGPTVRIDIQRRESSDSPEVRWHPRVLWVGVGCERRTPRTVIETAIEAVFREQNLTPDAIAGIATLDLKADEAGLVELCRDRGWPLLTFSPEELRSLKVPNPSAVVDREVGTPSVAEAAALRAAGADTLRVPKQIHRVEAAPPEGEERIGQAVTVAVAESEREYTGRTGELRLVGIGPGELSQMTPAAQTAVAGADAVVGYGLYLDLISPLLRPGQIVESFPITRERDRAERAIDLAGWGLTVAVVSSGDCGIYGMAGLVLEVLRSRGWDGRTPNVEVLPGISALQATAARVGTPLMHDFCAISLSDLLTPWEVIEKRLKAAAMADFACALYNPRSRTRTEQLAVAREIFLQYRPPETPVAIVRSAYRPDEEIALTTLEKLLEIPVDMLTTVLIGNESTRFYQNWMIAPRGYLKKTEA
ncbi:MAG: precorrin-3B C(17)-methyltransferase [Limnospira sp.]